MGSRIAISKSRQFSSALSSAVLEWLLMLLLYFDAFSSYLVTRFSRLCKLQNPCLLCSRLDHILGNEKSGYYWNLICDAHKLEISSLAFCRAHHKLADVHNMWEGCLLSFATEKKSNSETYRSLVGKLGVGLENGECNHFSSIVDADAPHVLDEDDVAKAPLLEDNISFSSSRKCSCCSELFNHKPHAVSLVQDKLIGVGATRFTDVNATGHIHPHQSIKGTGSLCASPDTQNVRNKCLDCFSDIGYSEVKITSDFESEVQVTDDHDVDDAPAFASEIVKQDFLSQCLQSEPVNILDKDFSSKLSNDTNDLVQLCPAAHETSELVSENKPYVYAQCEIPPFQKNECEIPEFSSSVAAGYDSDMANWNRIDVETNPPKSEIIADGTQDLLTSKGEPEISNITCIPTVHTVNDITKDWSSSEVNQKPSHDASDPETSTNANMDLNDVYKLAVGTRESLRSPSFKEVLMGKDSFKVQEGLKLLISEISASRGLESPWNEMSPSPRVYEQGDESVIQNITKTISIDRKESGLESLEGSIVSEIEGESVVERLKRQIELDRKSISLLYKELEEERNASATSANQAMAMITRLQEEKAAMQMEALHYQRMIEEQAEYDHEALQKCNELLTEREKEIQDLEADLENYKKCFTNEFSKDQESDYFSNCHDDESRYSNKSHLTNVISKGLSGTSQDSFKDSLLCFDDEKAYISDCLTKLEKKLLLFSNNGVYANISRFDANDEEHSDNICLNAHGKDCIQINAVTEKDARINGHNLDDASFSRDFEGHSNLHSCNKGEQSSNLDKNEPIVLYNDVLYLRRRLEALESDRDFLEHAMNSLKNGVDGAQFIQEIACDLRELRRIGIMRQKHHLL